MQFVFYIDKKIINLQKELMLAEKRQSNNQSSHYRISLSKPLIHSKYTSNRSISIAHTGSGKKDLSTNPSIIANKNISIERFYTNNEKQYYVIQSFNA